MKKFSIIKATEYILKQNLLPINLPKDMILVRNKT